MERALPRELGPKALSALHAGYDTSQVFFEDEAPLSYLTVDFQAAADRPRPLMPDETVDARIMCHDGFPSIIKLHWVADLFLNSSD